MRVQCKCGWAGDSDSLVNLAGGYYLHCPECSADFAPYPSHSGSKPIDGILELHHADGSKSRHQIIDGKPKFDT